MRMIDRLGSFDPCAKPSANDCYLREAATRRLAGVEFTNGARPGVRMKAQP
jgi:ribosomal protein S16